jgi:hypothetical protein
MKSRAFAVITVIPRRAALIAISASFVSPTRKTFPLISLGEIGAFPALAPDAKSIVFSQLDQADQTIMLVNHFR